MDKGQYDLCSKMLGRLDREGVLRHVVIIGSWCMLAYRDYFSNVEYHPAVRTRDIDILVPLPPAFTRTVDIEGALKDLDFVIGFKGSHGNISFVHRDLLLEFLVPEQGRGSDKPYPLPALGANAQRLRYLGFLAKDTIWGVLGGVRVKLPHPARFALHKLLISTRRKKLAERANDRRQGIYVLQKLVEIDKKTDNKTAFSGMPRNWRKLVRQALSEDLMGNAVLEDLGMA